MSADIDPDLVSRAQVVAWLRAEARDLRDLDGALTLTEEGERIATAATLHEMADRIEAGEPERHAAALVNAQAETVNK